jgi:hypothetical protein
MRAGEGTRRALAGTVPVFACYLQGSRAAHARIVVHPSCAGLTRASIFFAKTFYEERWIAGSSPAMTEWMDTQLPGRGHRAPLQPQACRNDRPLFSIDPNNDLIVFSLIRQ